MKTLVNLGTAACTVLGVVAGTGIAQAAPTATLEFRPATVVKTSSSNLPCKLVATKTGPGDTFRACGPDHRTVYEVAAAMVATTPQDAKSVRTPGGAWAVDVTLTPGSGEMVRRYTATHIGSTMALVHDGKVLAAPVVRDAVGSRIQIAVQGDQQAATRLAHELKG